MTQMQEFAELQRQWAEKGGGECDHPSTAQEFYLGSRTGDEGCLVCGDTWPRGKPSGGRGPAPQTPAKDD